ncbi:uncharacterized protein YALI1_C21513g [Yarrowia lipolytica]|nr:hypothetical protein YALI1_C21513g [Yarrowia lipolytica]
MDAHTSDHTPNCTLTLRTLCHWLTRTVGEKVEILTRLRFGVGHESALDSILTNTNTNYYEMACSTNCSCPKPCTNCACEKACTCSPCSCESCKCAKACECEKSTTCKCESCKCEGSCKC